MRTYKRLRRHESRARGFIADVARRQPGVFAHWRWGLTRGRASPIGRRASCIARGTQGSSQKPIAKRTVNIEPRGIYSITSKVFAKPGTVIETGAEIVRLKTRHIAPPDTNVNVYPDTGAQLGYALEIIFAIDDGQHEFSHLAIWKILGDVWKAVLRVERAAGINGLPLPHPDWTWEPEDL
jgi:hypothetical protein